MVAAAANLGPGLGVVAGSARWGALRLVRSWLGSDSPREVTPAERIGAFDGPPALPTDLTVLWQADPAFDRRAASLALHEALSEWRTAERRLAGMASAAGDVAHFEDDVTMRRATYQRRLQAIRTGLLEE